LHQQHSFEDRILGKEEQTLRNNKSIDYIGINFQMPFTLVHFEFAFSSVFYSFYCPF